jgi:hypothetical protein
MCLDGKNGQDSNRTRGDALKGVAAVLLRLQEVVET